MNEVKQIEFDRNKLFCHYVSLNPKHWAFKYVHKRHINLSKKHNFCFPNSFYLFVSIYKANEQLLFWFLLD